MIAALLALAPLPARASGLVMVPYNRPVFHNGHRVLFHGVWRGAGASQRYARGAAAAPEAQKPTVDVAKAAPAANHDFTVLADPEDICASRMASDLVTALRGAGLKARPIAGKGSPSAIGRFVLQDAADFAIVPLDALLSDDTTSPWRDRAPYIVKLGDEPIEIIAGRGVTDIAQLNDRPVSLGSNESDAGASAEALFRRLGVKPRGVRESTAASLADLAAGKLDAVVVVGASDDKSITDFGKDGRFHVVAIPWNSALSGSYAPARLTAKERPLLIGASDKVDTVATPMALLALDAATDTTRATQDAAAVLALFNKFDAVLASTSEPSWREVNLAASIDLPRLSSAKDWLDSHRQEVDAGLVSFRETAHTVAAAKDGPGPADADKLYQSLLQWRTGAHEGAPE